MIEYKSILEAAERLEGKAHKTPVFTSSQLDAATGNTVFLKCENFQRVGAFKFRGAYNALAKLSDTQKKLGVITYSSGNHAQGMALAGKLLGVSVKIVMPEDAPLQKITATKNYGGEIIFYHREEGDRKAIAEKIASEESRTVIPPFDHPDIIAGQGTSALELFQEVGNLDALLVPVGGGGLISGCAVAAHHGNPQCEIYGVETATGNDVKLSLDAGHIISIPVPQTIADGMQTTSPGDLTFAIMRKHVAEVLLVTDEQILSSMRFLAERMKIITEPSGATGVAALFNNTSRWKKRRIGIILSGGNVDWGLWPRVTASTTLEN